MANFRGINPLLADVWATFLGNSSVVLRVPTYLHKQTRDYVDSGDGLQDSITVTPTHNLTSLRPADPSQNTLTPLSLLPGLWKHPACMGSPGWNELYYWSFALHSYRHHYGARTLNGRQIGYQESVRPSIIWWGGKTITIIHTRYTAHNLDCCRQTLIAPATSRENAAHTSVLVGGMGRRVSCLLIGLHLYVERYWEKSLQYIVSWVAGCVWRCLWLIWWGPVHHHP